jgi:hypothetical protein
LHRSDNGRKATETVPDAGTCRTFPADLHAETARSSETETARADETRTKDFMTFLYVDYRPHDAEDDGGDTGDCDGGDTAGSDTNPAPT